MKIYTVNYKRDEDGKWLVQQLVSEQQLPNFLKRVINQGCSDLSVGCVGVLINLPSAQVPPTGEQV